MNRTHKTAILGLGAWAGRKFWPLPWVSALECLKTFGIMFVPSLGATTALSWEDCLARVQGAIQAWRGKGVPLMRERRDVFEMFIFSKIWFIAQILPCPRRWQLGQLAGGLFPVEGQL